MNCECRSHNGFLTAKGLEGATQRRREIHGVDNMDMFGYIDKVSSVSGLELERDLFVDTTDEQLDEQARRFHHGW